MASPSDDPNDPTSSFSLWPRGQEEQGKELGIGLTLAEVMRNPRWRQVRDMLSWAACSNVQYGSITPKRRILVI